MNEHLQNIVNTIEQSRDLSDEVKDALLKEAKAADKAFTITAFKLERTEKVKYTTAVLLEETIEELEQKRKTVETQNKELEIESALERVRSRSMAMQKSEELREVIQVVYDQFVRLNIHVEHTGFIMDYKETQDMHIWLADKQAIPFQVIIPYFDSAHWNSFIEAKEKGSGFFANTLSFEEKNKFYQDLFQHITDVPEEARAYYFSCAGLSISTVLMEDIGLYIENFSGIPYAVEENKTLMRFGRVFQQTYTRFLDLKKAESQAGESQIQLALERVRARTMAMQQSTELPDAANILFQQMQTLGMPAWSAGYCIWDDDKQAITLWMSSAGIIQKPFRAPVTDDPSFIHFYDAWKRGETFYVEEIGGDAIISHYQYMLRLPVVGEMLHQFIADGGSLPTFQIFHLAFFSQGFLLFITYQSVPGAHEIFKRFGNVFDQTYTRFLDLKKAEAQSRESQIQLALERVRARTMAMQKSDELSDAVYILFQQFKELDEKPDQATIGIINEDEKVIEFWVTMYGSQINKVFKFSIDEPNVTNKIYKAWKENKKTLVIDLSGDALTEFMTYRAGKGGAAINPEERRRIINVAFFSKGLLNVQSNEERSEESIKLLERFASVFEQTYTRFLDLQTAEAQALEAVKRASVDRVRAEIASMRTKDDLERITPLIWSELKTIGVPFIRCGVFIMDEAQQKVQTLLSTPDGKAIATLHVPFDFNLPIITNGVAHWRGQQMYQEHWDALAFSKSWSVLTSLRDTSVESSQVEHPPENLYLHLLPFLQGMLYVGNESPLAEEELQLVQNLADAFSTAYARYEDFNKLESANVKIEKTLVDLKQTQAQLVQSEKMASLGELTAGIAHEIQNPLNFVNNFSEVNKELLAELNEEIEKGNYEEAKIIASDIAGNEEKIIHHGKRADSIVKGMLQHSRSSTGLMEPTDINALCDEYLRLAYHGLRAKDKSFNATMKTGYDETVGKINIIPQDIGRAILNIITNAFYAVNEKKKIQVNGYEPTISLSTKKTNEGIEITLADNGNGIPKKIVDKIFQPFFTTKPTGQGTGLGLSLAYDILKAHSGNIKVETKENEGLPGESSRETGTEFIIQLPS